MLKEERDYLIETCNFKLLERLQEAYQEGLREGLQVANVETLFSLIRSGALTIDQAYDFVSNNSDFDRLKLDKQQFQRWYEASKEKAISNSLSQHQDGYGQEPQTQSP